MREALKKSLEYWDKWHAACGKDSIKLDEWLDPFGQIIEKCSTPILDLGCGNGNNTLYFLDKGKLVIPCDQSPNAIENIRVNFPEVSKALCFNFLDGFDFEDQSFEIICADLCLHYFTMEDTTWILREIKRILVPGGHVFVRVNSLKDTLHGAGQGQEIEKHLYQMEDGTLKRFFDEDDIRCFFSEFDILFCKEQRMKRYTKEKMVYTVCLQKDTE